MKFTRRTMLAGGLTGAATWTFAPIGAHAQAKEMMIGIPVQTNSSLPIYLAAGAGYLKAEGIEAKVSTGASGTNARQMIAAGQMPYAEGDPIHPLALSSAGKAAKMLMAFDKRASIAMLIRKELWDKGIRTPEAFADYKGPGGAKPKLGVTRVGAQFWLFGVELMKRVGKADAINYVSLGAVANIIGAFRTGQIDACMANPIVFFSILDEKLGGVAFDPLDNANWNRMFGASFPGEVLFALESQVKANPELTQKVVNACWRAMLHIKRSSPEEIETIVRPKFLPNFKKEIAIREVEYLKPLFDFDCEVTKATFDAGSKVWFTPQTKVKPQTFEAIVDNTFIREAKSKIRA
jgi:ABC-type nitrate/sulfonate/bicarbonate transport system substrate-binding protein